MTKHRAAEKKVASFFADEGCVANEPDEDIHGWDVFVEFPRPLHSGPAEEEPPHPKAYIQVKSTEGRGNSAPIKLSNVQIAVTSHDPWFIIRAYPDHTYRVVHVWDDILLGWTKAVRKANLDAKILHKEKLTLTFPGPRISGSELATVILRMIESVGRPYANKKQQLIEYLRDSDGFGTGNFTLQASNENRLAMIFLGLEKRVPVSNAHLTRMKFGILDNTPFVGPTDGLISIEPIPIAKCEIRFLREDGSRFLNVFGDVTKFTPPGSPAFSTFFRFSAPPMELVRRPDGSVYSRLGAEKSKPVLFTTIERWAMIGSELERGDVEIIVSEGGPTTVFSTRVKKSLNPDRGYSALGLLVTLMRESGNTEATYTVEEIDAAMGDLYLLSQIVSEGSIRAEFELEDDHQPLDYIAYWFDVTVGTDVYFGYVDLKVRHQTLDCNRHTLYLSVSNLPPIYFHRDVTSFDREEIERQFIKLRIEDGRDSKVGNFGNIIDRLKDQIGSTI